LFYSPNYKLYHYNSVSLFIETSYKHTELTDPLIPKGFGFGFSQRVERGEEIRQDKIRQDEREKGKNYTPNPNPKHTKKINMEKEIIRLTKGEIMFYVVRRE